MLKSGIFKVKVNMLTSWWMSAYQSYCYCMLVIVSLLFVTSTEAQNLLNNPGFENGTNSWNATSPAASSTDYPNCGSNNGWTGDGGGLSQTINITSSDIGCTYKLDFEAYRHAIGTGWVWIGLYAYDTDSGSWVNLESNGLNSNIGAWTSYTLELIPPPGTDVIQVWFGSGSGASWRMDCLELTKECPPSCSGSPNSLTRTINSSNDDAEENSSGSVNLTSSDLELVQDGSNQIIGLRFENITIPQGATISSARIEFETDETSWDQTNLTFYCQDINDAPAFTTASNNISSRTKTTASEIWHNLEAWDTVDEKHQSPELYSIVQEVINRSGWSSGNDLAFIIEGSGKRFAESYDGESAAAATIELEYCTSSGGNCSGNLLTNEGFESGTASWTFDSNASISSDANSGSNSARLGVGAGGVSQSFSVSPGETYTMEGYAKETAAEEIVFGFNFYDSSWNLISAHNTPVTGNTYEVYYITATAPDNAAFIAAHGYKDAGNGEAYFDDYCMHEWVLNTPSCSNNYCELDPSWNSYIWSIDPLGTGDHWMDYDNSDLMLCDNGDGTMTIKGNIINGQDATWGSAIQPPCGSDDGWYVELDLFDKQTWSEFQGNYVVNANCPNAYLDLDYWDCSGTMTGIGCNSGTSYTINGPTGNYRIQIGDGGNSHNCDWGISTWFDIESSSGLPMLSDIYARIEETCYNTLNQPNCPCIWNSPNIGSLSVSGNTITSTAPSGCVVGLDRQWIFNPSSPTCANGVCTPVTGWGPNIPLSYTATTPGYYTLCYREPDGAGDYCYSENGPLWVESSSSCNISIRALGSCGVEDIELRLNGSTVATYALGTSFQTFTYSNYNGSDDISIFFQDGNTGCDNNARIDYIQVGGTQYHTESVGSHSNTSCNGGEWLWCTGTVSFGAQTCEGGISYGCIDDVTFEHYASSCDNGSITVNVPNTSNVNNTLIQVVYKGCDPGNTITIGSSNGNLTLDKVSLSGGSSSVYLYETELSYGVTNLTHSPACGSCVANNGLQSMIAFVERSVDADYAYTGVLTNLSGYCDVETITVPIPSWHTIRDVDVVVPISEVTDDGRYLTVEASSNTGIATASQTIYGSDPSLGDCCLNVVELTIANVPANSTAIEIDIITNTANNPNGSSCGQSWVISGYVYTAIECACIPVTAEAGPNKNICPGGSVTLEGSHTGGFGTVEYHWDPYQSLNNSKIAEPTAFPTSTTTYTLTVIGSDGCSDTDQVVVTVNPTPTANAGPDQEVCNGGSVSLTASGGTTYAWSNGAGSTATVSVSPTTTTTYTVTVTDSNGCTDTDQVDVAVINQYTNGGTIAGDETICGTYDPANITNSSSPSGGSGGTASYRWQSREMNCTTGNWGSWTVISGATSSTYNPTTITVSTQYRRQARRSTGCSPSWISSNTVVKNVAVEITNGGVITGDQEACGAFNPTTITGTDPSGFCAQFPPTYQWQSRPYYGGGWVDVAGATSATYDPPQITETTQYRRRSRSSVCPYAYSNIVTLTINNDPLVSLASIGFCPSESEVLEPEVCEYYPDITATRPLENSGWANQYDQGGSALTGDGQLCVELIDSYGSTNYQMFGLNSDPNSNNSFNTIDYAIYIVPTPNNHRVLVYENGTNRGQKWQSTSSMDGSTFCVRRTGTTIEYLKDGEIIYTSTVASNANLYYDNSFHSGSGNISFENIQICANASDINMTYSWNGGSSAATKSVNSAGTHTVTVTDVNGCSTSVSVSVQENSNEVTPSAAGGSSVCDGGSVTLTVGAANLPSYSSYDNNLEAYYPFINDLKDYSSSNLHLEGNSNFNSGGLRLTTSSNYISDETGVLDTDNHTVSFYIKPMSVTDGSWRRIFNYNDRTPGLWMRPNSTKIHWRYNPGNGGLEAEQDMNVGEWYHIVGVKNGATFKYYMNGELITSNNVPSPKLAGSFPLKFGGADVVLREFKIFDFSMSDAQVADMGQWVWYAGGCGTGSPIGTGASIEVNPSTTTTYFVRWETDCDNSGCDSETVTIYGDPIADPGNNGNLCSGQSHDWIAADAGAGASYVWDFGSNANPSSASGIGPHSVTYAISGMSNVSTITTLTVTDSNGCINTATDGLSILAIPQGSAVGTDPSCDAEDGEITITFQDSPNRTGIEFSIDNQVTWSTSVNDNTGSYTFSNLAAGTYQVWSRWGDDSCPTFFNNVVLNPHTDITDPGSITGGSTQCDSYDPPLITSSTDASGGEGPSIVYRWQYREWDCDTETYGSWSTISSSNSPTYDPGLISITTQFRRQANRTGCASWDNTNTVTFEIINHYTSGGTISGTETMCGSYDPDEIINTADPEGGCSGVEEIRWYKWERDCATAAWGSGIVVTGATDLSYDPPLINVSTRYRRYVRRGTVCDGTNGTWMVSNYIYKYIDENISSGGTISSDQEACGSFDPSILSGTQPSGYCSSQSVSYQWQYRDGYGGNFISIEGATDQNYDPPTITNTRQYKRIASTGSCGDLSSNIITLTINESPTLVVPDAAFCPGGEVSLEPEVCVVYPIIEAQRPLEVSGWANAYNEGGHKLIGDGEFCFTLDAATNTAQMLGLNSDPYSSDNFNSLDFAIYIYVIPASSTYLMQIRENGTSMGNASSGVNFIGSEFCIRRTGTTIGYYLDGNLVFTSAKTSSSDLYFDNSFLESTNATWVGGYSKFSNITLCGEVDDFDYSWSNGAITETINVSAVGAYTLEVTDLNGCTVEATSNVSEFTPPNAMISADGDVTCDNTTVTLTATPAGMSYAWSGGGANQTKTVSAGGTYTITITDSNGCTDEASIEVIENTTPTNIYCQRYRVYDQVTTTWSAWVDFTGDCIIEICENGGQDDIQFDGGPNHDTGWVWTDEDGNVDSEVDELVVFNNIDASDAGIYNGTYTNEFGCVSNVSFEVVVNINPTANAGPDQTICEGGTASLTASGGDTYQWSHSLGTNPTVSISPASTTTYSVTVTDLNGCTATDEVIVNVQSDPTINVGDENICIGETATLTASPSGGIGTVSYQWQKSLNGTTWEDISGATSISYTTPALMATSYYRLTGNWTGIGCSDIVSNTATVTVELGAQIAGILSSEPESCSGEPIVLTVNDPSIINGGEIDHSSWTAGTGSVGIFNRNGSDTENHRIVDTDPWGNSTIVWEARPDATSNADGGWNSSQFDIDNTQTYRVSVWVNRKVLGTNGRFYLGSRAYGTVDGLERVTNDVVTTNPYLYVSPTPPTNFGEDQWVLVVGHIHPHTHSASSNHTDSGLYNTCEGRIGNINYDYRWLPESMTALHRTYLYYCTDVSVRQQWVYPRFDLIDGTEPTIDQLLNGFDSNNGQPAGINWTWHTGSCNGTQVGTGTSITVSPTENTTYYVKASGACNGDVCESITVDVLGLPVADPGDNGELCDGESHTWVAANAGTGASYDWNFGPYATPATATGIGPHTVLYDITGMATINTTTTLTVTDANGCQNTGSDGFPLLARPDGSVSGVDPGCNVDDGEIIITFIDSPNRTGIEFSIDDQVTWSSAVNDNTGTYTFSNLSDGTYDIWVRWGDDDCPTEFGSVTLNPYTDITNPGSISGGDSQCGSYDPEEISSATAAWGGEGADIVYRWQYREWDCLSETYGSWITISSSNSETFDPASISVSTEFRRQANRVGCTGWDNSNVVTFELYENGDAGNISANQSFCNSGDPLELTGSLPTGGCFGTPSYRWQYREGTSGTWLVVTEATGQNYDPGLVSTTTQYRRQTRMSSLCPYVNSGILTITIDDSPEIDLGASRSICENTITTFTTSDIGVGASYDWDFGPQATPSNATGLGPHDVSYVNAGTNGATMNNTVVLTVTDANGCVGTDDVIVNIYKEPSATVSYEQPTCEEANGEIILTFEDNASRTNIEFSIDGGTSFPYGALDDAGTYTINGLAPGSYDVWIRWGDDNCPIDLPDVTLTNQASPEATATVNGTITCDNSSVTLTANPAGMMYAWSGGGTGRTKSVAVGGTYTVTVSDSNGCTDMASIYVYQDTESPSVTLDNHEVCTGTSVTLVPDLCENYGDIQAQRPLNISGWANKFGSTASGLIGDGEICVTLDQSIDSSPQMFGFNDNPNASNSFSDIEHALYVYIKPDGTSYRVNVYESGTSIGLFYSSATSYDGSTFCIRRTGTSVDYLMDGNVLHNSTSASTGTVYYDNSFHSGGGVWTGGYSAFTDISICGDLDLTYEWSTGDTSKEITVSSSGTYTVTVTSANSCVSTASSVVSNFTNPMPDLGASRSICENTITTFTTSDIGAGASYDWDFGPQATPSTATGLGPHDVSYVNAGTNGATMNNTVVLTVTDANGCVGTDDVIVNIFEEPSATVSYEQPTCEEANGEIILTFEDNASRTNIEFSIDGGTSFPYGALDDAGTYTINGLAPGSYDVWIRWGDDNCPIDLPDVTLTNQASPVASVSGNGDVTCDNTSVTLTATPAGMMYAWTGGGDQQTKEVTVGGDYTVTVTDANGCSDVATISVVENTTPTNIFCERYRTNQGGSWQPWINFSGACIIELCEDNGLTDIQFDGGPNFDTGWIWTDEDGNVDAEVDEIVTFSNIDLSDAGTYNGAYTNEFGCQSFVSFEVVVHANPTPEAGSDQTICEGGQVVLSASGGSTYAWSDNLGSTAQVNVSPTQTTTYTVTVTDSNGCTASDQVSVFVEAAPIITLTDQNICSGETATLSSTINGGIGTVSYQWQISTNEMTWVDISGATNDSYSTAELQATTYYRLTADWTGTGCSGVISNTATVNVELGAIIGSLISTDSNICEGEEVTITVNESGISNGGEIDHSSWTVGTGSVGMFNRLGTNEENHRINGIDPWGNPSVVWEARPDAANNGDGGWNSDVFDIDHTKLYRVSVWVNRKVMGNDGRFYLGLYGYGDTNGVERVNNGTIYTNPYFYYSAAPPAEFGEDEWVMVVGHVRPSDHVGTTNHSDSGIYNVGDGRIGNIHSDFRWLAESLTAQHRTYLFYCTDVNVRQQWVYPRFDIVDGTEPSIDDLLQGLDSNDGLPNGASWTWHEDSCNGSQIGTGQSITVTPTETTTYYVKANGVCNEPVCEEITINVNQLPNVSLSLSETISCITETTITLDGHSPEGGAFSGPGVMGTNFDPSIAGAGTHTITYTYEDANGCEDIAIDEITVYELPVVSLNLTTPTICVNGGEINLEGGSPSNGIYSGAGVSGSTFDPEVAGVGVHIITYTYQDSHGCENVATANLEVYGEPIAALDNNVNICSGEIQTWTATDAGSGVSYNWDFGPNATPAIATGIGPHDIEFNVPGIANVSTVVSLTVSDLNGCENSASDAFTILAIPTGSLVSTDPGCDVDNGEIIVSFQDSPNRTGIEFSLDDQSTWTASVNDNSGSYTFSDLAAGTYEVWVRWGDNSCPTYFGSVVLNPYTDITDPGEISGGESQCGEFDPSQISSVTPATGGTGANLVYRWQFREWDCNSENFNSWDWVEGNSDSESYDPSAISVTTEYRRMANRVGCQDWSISNTVVFESFNNDVDSGNISEDQSFCTEDTPNELTGPEPSGGCYGEITYQWQSRVAGGSWTNVSTTQNYAPGLVSETTEYKRLTRRSGLCPWEESNIVTVTIFGLPTVSLNLPTTESCTNNNILTLEGGAPTGGSYSGEGVNNGLFDPAEAGPGSHTITYTYETTDGCSNNATDLIVVSDTTQIFCERYRIREYGEWGAWIPLTDCIIELCEEDGLSDIQFDGGPNFDTGWTWMDEDGNVDSEVDELVVFPDIGLDDAGIYSGTYTSPEGCVSSLYFEVIVNESPEAIASNNEVLCSGESVEISVGGSGSYAWSPSEGLSDPSISNPIASPATSTTYTVTVTASNGCSSTATVEVQVFDCIETSNCHFLHEFNNSSYFGSDGTESWSSYGWDEVGDNNSANSGDIMVVMGYLMMEHSDATLPSIQRRVDLSERSTAALRFDFWDSGELDPDDTFNVEVFDGTTWHEVFTFSGAVTGTETPIIDISSYIAANTEIKIGILSGFEDAGERLNIDNIRIDVDCLCPDIADAGIDLEICHGDSIQLNGSGGVMYSWSPASSLTNASLPNPMAFPTEETTYTLTVTDDRGCTDTAQVTVSVNESVGASVTAVVNDECLSSEGEITITVTEGNAPFTVGWQTTDGEQQGTATMNSTGDHTIGGLEGGNTFCIEVIDSNGCKIDTP